MKKNIIYNNFQNLNEITTKINLVRNFFESLKYNPNWFSYEQRTTVNTYIDISINVPNNLPFIIEVKKEGTKLKSKDLIQLLGYLNTEGFEWGCLTNGYSYILFNNRIQNNATNKEVLRFYKIEESNMSISKQRNKNNLKFFSYKYLYKTKVTNYYRFLTEFKNTLIKNNNSNNISFRQYESVIYNFLDFLSESDYPYDPERINDIFLFKKYLKSSKNAYNNRQLKKKKTIINKYRYINSFCQLLKDQNIILKNKFENITEKDMLDEFDINDKKCNIEPLNYFEANEILNSFKEERQSIRNKLIIALLIYTGMDISEMQTLKITDFNKNNQTLNVNSRIIELPEHLCYMIQNYLELRKKKKLKSEYLFCSKYNGKINQVSIGLFSTILKNQLKFTNISEKRKKVICPYFFKYSLIRSLLDAKISLQEISKYTGLTIETICDYLTEENLKKVNCKNIIKKHPYNKICQKL